MSFMRALASRNEQRGADPTLPWGSSVIPTNGQIGFTAAGVPMNDDTALSISTVYACVALLADGVATLPLISVKKDAKGVSHQIDTPQLLLDPWPEILPIDFFTQMMVSLTLRGNFYGRIVDRDKRGLATMIMPYHPDRVLVRRNVTSGKLEYRIDNGILIPSADVVHVRSGLQVPGSAVALNPVEYMRQSWALAAAAEKYGGQFFANSANASGIISVDGDLSEEEALEMGRAWKMGHQGLGNAQLPAVLTGGARWTQISISPDDAQFLQTRSYQRQDILAFYRIPPHKMGLQDRTAPTATGVESTEIIYVTDTLLPWLLRIAAYLTKLMAPGIETRFDLTGRLKGNTLERFQAYQIGRNGGWLNVNEVRIKEGLEPLPDGSGGDTYLQPANMQLLGTQSASNPAASPPNDSGVDNGGGTPITPAPDGAA